MGSPAQSNSHAPTSNDMNAKPIREQWAKWRDSQSAEARLYVAPDYIINDPGIGIFDPDILDGYSKRNVNTSREKHSEPASDDKSTAPSKSLFPSGTDEEPGAATRQQLQDSAPTTSSNKTIISPWPTERTHNASTKREILEPGSAVVSPTAECSSDHQIEQSMSKSRLETFSHNHAILAEVSGTSSDKESQRRLRRQSAPSEKSKEDESLSSVLVGSKKLNIASIGQPQETANLNTDHDKKNRKANGSRHSPAAIAALQAAYQRNPNLEGNEREELSEQTGLTDRQIQNWFSHKRNPRKSRRRRTAARLEEVLTH